MPPHLVIATPCYGGTVTSHYTMSLLALQNTCLQRKIDLSFQLCGGDALITRARNVLVQQFLAIPHATHLLFVDADIGFTPDQALALLAADKDVVGGVYPLKHLDWDRVRRQAQSGQPQWPSSALHYVVELLEETAPPPDQDFIRVRSLGTGFMMVKREVFIRMAEHYPETRFREIHVGSNVDLAHQSAHALFDGMIDPESGVYLSEDYTFCKRWIAMGGEIWAHAKSRLLHVGSHAFEGDLAAMLRTVKKE